MLTHGSLFSGIGGFDLGFERAGIETAWQVEIDPYCRRVLERHFPSAQRYDDVRTVGKHNLAPVDIISGGFPCQDISNAGKRAGIDGEHSGLWSEYERIIGELRPRFVVIENVAALLSSGEWREEPIDKCVCGWPYRWRGMHHDSAPKDEVVLGKDRCGDVSEGNAVPGEAESLLRRPHPQDARKKRTVGRGVRVGAVREGRNPISGSDSATSGIEETAGDVRNQPAKNDCCPPASTARGRSVDAGSSRGSDYDSGFGSGVESEGTDRTEDGRLVCPSCGRQVDNATTRPVFLSAMGRVLGDLAALRYDAEWDCIPAAAVGAPHIRDRVWLLAYPRRESRCVRDDGQNGCDFVLPEGSGVRTEAEWGEDRELITLVPGIDQRKAEDWWRAQSRMARSSARIPGDVDRLKGLGNAIIPQIAEWIGKRIVDATQSKNK